MSLCFNQVTLLAFYFLQLKTNFVIWITLKLKLLKIITNIDKRFSKETGLPVNIADDPLSCVAIGTGKALDDQEIFSTVLSEY